MGSKFADFETTQFMDGPLVTLILPSNDSNPSTFSVRLAMSRISQRTSDSLGIPNALFNFLILLGSPLVEAISATKNKRCIQ